MHRISSFVVAAFAALALTACGGPMDEATEQVEQDREVTAQWKDCSDPSLCTCWQNCVYACQGPNTPCTAECVADLCS